MRNRCHLRRPLLWGWFPVAVALALLVWGCRFPQQPAPAPAAPSAPPVPALPEQPPLTAPAPPAPTSEPREVPADVLKPLWEVWSILKREFVEKSAVNGERLGPGAIRGLLKAAGKQGPVPPAPLAPLPLPAGAPEELEAVWEAWTGLYQRGEGPGDAAQAAQAAIRGLLEALGDPHTEYIPPEQFRLMDRDFRGTYEGIGAEVFNRDGKFILNPFPESPAAKAGIRPGDVVLEVDGRPVEGWPLLELITRIRGPRGTSVTLKVVHLEEKDTRTLQVTRGLIRLETVFSSLTPERFAHIRLTGFYETTDDALQAKLTEIRQQGARGIILDLRNNPGGLLSVVVEVSGQFLKEGVVVIETDGTGRRVERKVRRPGQAAETPLVVLVNQFSASGSEVLAGALQDHGRAPLIGVKTFGKGSINLVRALSDGGGLYFSFARWLTPKGRLIEGRGLEPDLVVAPTMTQGADPQMEKALELLRRRVGAGG